MRPHTTPMALITLLVVAGAACAGGSDSVEVPGAATTVAVTARSADTTTSSTAPPVVTELPTPTPAPTTTGPPATEAPPSTQAAPTETQAAPPDTEAAPETTVGRNPDFLRQGDEGSRVGLVQFKLVALGYLPTGGDTGVFDSATNSAVLSFQSDYGLIVDGVIGPETERAISAAAESINPEQS